MLKKIFGALNPGRAAIFEPRMPDIEAAANPAEVFAQARSVAAAGAPPGSPSSARHVIVVTPGRLMMLQPCPAPGSMPAAQVASIEQMIPPTRKRNIVAIAYTELGALQADASRAIPFLGMLLGFAYIGHAVWVFEGHPSALAEGCRDADVLIVDGGMLPCLSADWQKDVRPTMRRPEIYVHDRKDFRLKPLSVAKQ
jgi:hypothetical protein